MNLIKIALRSVQHRSLASGLTALSISLGVALVVTVLVINGVISKTFRQGAQGYDLILGAKGSKLQLVLSTVFYNQDPLPPIPYRYYTLLNTSRYSSEVEAAIPIAMGDRYQGSPVIGTIPDYFKKLIRPDGKPYSFMQGEVFRNSDIFAAVVGYTTAKQHRIKLGDKIRFGHSGGTRDDDLHEPFTVVGILDHTGSPNDRAVFVNLEGFYQQHEGDEGPLKVDYSLLEAEKDAQQTGAGDARTEDGAGDTGHDDADHDHDHDRDHDHAAHERRLTAVLIVTKEQDTRVAATMSQIDQMMENQPGVSFDETQLVSRHQRRKVVNTAVTALQPKLEGELLEAQAVAPVQEIAAFYQDVIGNIQYILILFAVQVIIVAGIGMMVSIYNSMNERRQEIAIMRALGARRVTVMSIILLESILLSLGGGILGVLIGHGLVWGLSPLIMEYSNVMVRFWDFQFAELILIPGLIAMASVVGYLPAVIAYRTDVAQSLQP
ncbi:MAG: ABC transporter permease [Thermoguttaceae bacterium]|nr:ABC transporter permease [Thermoguttaceae bacterium]